MRKYGSKKSSRPGCQIHGTKFCGQCAEMNEAPVKSRRSNEKRAEDKEIADQIRYRIVWDST